MFNASSPCSKIGDGRILSLADRVRAVDEPRRHSTAIDIERERLDHADGLRPLLRLREHRRRERRHVLTVEIRRGNCRRTKSKVKSKGMKRESNEIGAGAAT
jgi:hypothetical protein